MLIRIYIITPPALPALSETSSDVGYSNAIYISTTSVLCQPAIFGSWI